MPSDISGASSFPGSLGTRVHSLGLGEKQMAHSTPPRGARLRHDLLRIAIASSLCVPAGAMGQELLDEIVVTARFREENLQQTPLAITAFTGEMLESRGATSTLDLDAFVPNAVIAPLGAGWGSTAAAFIRG